MDKSDLLTQVLLEFDDNLGVFSSNLSAARVTPDGHLWVASDEAVILPDKQKTEVNSIDRLSIASPDEELRFSKHKRFLLKDLLKNFDDGDGEVDIEGLAYENHYLWVIGSHGTKRKKLKGDQSQFHVLSDEERKKLEKQLKKVEFEKNRSFLARIPINHKGNLKPHCLDPENGDRKLVAACLQKTNKGYSNVLLDALQQDMHLAPFFLTLNPDDQAKTPLPGKDNGLDIEGIAVRDNRIFLGLRGPVLRGWAIVLEIEVAESPDSKTLILNAIESNDQLYKKHFVKLGGLGIRDLCFYGDDLLILAGPTMELDGPVRVFRLKDSFNHLESIDLAQKRLTLELEIPYGEGEEHAEGMTLMPMPDGSIALLVLYDSPSKQRKPKANKLWADLFKLN